MDQKLNSYSKFHSTLINFYLYISHDSTKGLPHNTSLYTKKKRLDTYVELGKYMEWQLSLKAFLSTRKM